MVKKKDQQKRLEDYRAQIRTKNLSHSVISKRCSHCGSEEYCKDGSRKTKYKGKIRVYRCKKCRRKFSLDPFPRTHFPLWVYEKILRLSAEGNRAKAIAEEIEASAMEKGIDLHISPATVLYIFKDMVTLMVKIEDEYHHQVLANEWQIDDCYQRLPHRQWAYITNVLAVDTRYWLSSSVSFKRDTDGSKEALEQSVRRSGYFPIEIRCDGWRGHAAAIKQVLKHVHNDHRSKKKKKKNYSIVNYTERLNRTMRRVILKGKTFPTEELLQAYTDLKRLQYNFLEKHKSLGKKTPAEAAGIQLTIKNWKDMIKLAIQYKKRSRRTRRMTLHQFVQDILKIS